ncbi:Hypothetical_protein [Hexamita inflata]|uniref:Hypothetical_protein n=1 Tax=Hexamita inflata TaxID=28002 RepID=A0AA86NTY4_9EUKA|nr:Hypothetical protein HINF_LOCUS13720 [Hexamita inflata]
MIYFMVTCYLCYILSHFDDDSSLNVPSELFISFKNIVLVDQITVFVNELVIIFLNLPVFVQNWLLCQVNDRFRFLLALFNFISGVQNDQNANYSQNGHKIASSFWPYQMHRSRSRGRQCTYTVCLQYARSDRTLEHNASSSERGPLRRCVGTCSTHTDSRCS